MVKDVARPVLGGGHMVGVELPPASLAPRILTTEALIGAGQYTRLLIDGHAPTVGEKAPPYTALHVLGVAGLDGAMPSWFSLVLANLVDAGVPIQEIHDAVRRGPRAIDGMLARYGVGVPAL